MINSLYNKIFMTASLIFSIAFSIYLYKNRDDLWLLRKVEWPSININIPSPAIHRNFSPREWLHQVNNLDRVRFAKKQNYFGIETDVVFDDKHYYFDVGRPSLPSIGLNLASIIAETGTPEKYYFWLDFKNLTEQNKYLALSALNKLAHNYNIHDRIIVESPNVEALSIFTDAGYYTSFYLPTININRMSKSKLKNFALSVLQQTLKARFCAVSGDVKLYEFANQYFPSYDHLHWLPAHFPIFSPIKAKDIKADSGVKVILFEDYSDNNR